MSIPAYPSTLPGPQPGAYALPNRRAASSLPGPLQQRSRQWDLSGGQRTHTFIYTAEQMGVWRTWWRDTLLQGRRWFTLSLPGYEGMTPRVVRYLEVSQSLIGAGVYAVEARLELRESNKVGPTRPVLFDEIIADAPAAYWRLGEASGSTVANEVSGGLSGTIVGGVTLGRPSLDASSTNTAALFNGSTGYVTIGGTGSYNYSRNFSIVLLCMRPTGSIGRALISHGRFGFYLRAGPEGVVEFLRSQSSTIGSAPDDPIQTDRRTMVGLTVSAGTTATWRLYINGRLSNSGTTTAVFSSPSGPLLFAVDYFSAPNTEFGGYVLDEVAIFATELAANRMLAYATAAIV